MPVQWDWFIERILFISIFHEFTPTFRGPQDSATRNVGARMAGTPSSRTGAACGSDLVEPGPLLLAPSPCGRPSPRSPPATTRPRARPATCHKLAIAAGHHDQDDELDTAQPAVAARHRLDLPARPAAIAAAVTNSAPATTTGATSSPSPARATRPNPRSPPATDSTSRRDERGQLRSPPLPRARRRHHAQGDELYTAEPPTRPHGEAPEIAAAAPSSPPATHTTKTTNLPSPSSRGETQPAIAAPPTRPRGETQRRDERDQLRSPPLPRTRRRPPRLVPTSTD